MTLNSAHLLISANHRMERFRKNDPWVILNKITSSSMTLSEGNRHSFRISLANERYFHIKSFSRERFSAGLNVSHNGLFFPQMGLIKLNLYPLRRRSQNCSMEILSAPSIFNFEARFETFHSTGLTHTSKAVAC